jgi:hypothetical protein
MNSKSNQGNLWFGLLIAAAGNFIMLVALDVIPSPEENFHAPRWVVLIAGLSFFAAGVYMALIDRRFEALQDEIWFRLILKTVQLSIPLSLLAVLNWVAFGPVEREFSSSISLPFFSFSTENSNQIMGRCVFGTTAVVSDLVLLFIAVRAVLQWVNAGDKDTD